MNGEFGELLVKLKEELAVLKAEDKLRWDMHDKRSYDNWEYIKEKLEKLDNLPCDKHIGKFTMYDITFGFVWAAITCIVGVLIKHIVK